MPATQTSPALERELESHRRPLTGYCYRMLGSGSEAEDAVQETMVRAWRSADKLKDPGALKSWLYRIASNVCLDMLGHSQRRARPMDLGPASSADAPLGAMLPESVWVQPIADSRVLEPDGDPAAIAEARETLRLAFVAALQHLPPRQRAVLVLREVLRWQASEVAELLDTSVASVNSALQRSRATLASLDLDPDAAPGIDERQQELLDGYVDAFERYDMPALVALLHEDATFTMPPFALWLRGPQAAAEFMLGPGAHCRGSRLLTTRANGGPAVAVYHATDEGPYLPWALVLVETSAGQITSLHHAIGGPELFAQFGLPARLEGQDAAQPQQA